MIASGSKSDPFKLFELPIAAASGFYDVTGRTEVNPALTSGETTGVFIIVGESTAANCVDSTYGAVLQAKNHNFCIYNGGCYRSAEPLLGTNISGFVFIGHWALKLADDLISGGKYARIILVPVAIGGTLASDWASTTGAFPGHRAAVTANRLSSAGLTPTAILQILGANDCNAGTSQSSYAASQAIAIQNWRDAGVTCPYFVAKSTWFNGTVSAGIQAAQLAIVDGITIFAGPNCDAFDGTNRYDNTHWNATGRNAVANAWKTTIESQL